MDEILPTVKSISETSKELKQASKLLARPIKSLSRLSGFFSPFKPKTKSVEINYRSRQASLIFTIETPESVKKRNRKIVIPKTNYFSVGFVQNDYFDQIEDAWKETETELILPIANIPGNRFLVELIGEIDYRSLDLLVKTYCSANRDFTPEIDKYILQAHIRNVEFFERSYKSLIINDIPFKVKVELSKTITQTIPMNLQRKLSAYDEYKAAARTANRQKIHRAMIKAIKAEREGWTMDLARSFIQRVGNVDFYKSFLELTGQFDLSGVETSEIQEGFIIPKVLSVSTETYLDLNQPISNGELIFKRKELQNSLNEEFDRRIKQK